MNTLNSNNHLYNIGVSSCLLGHAVRYDGKHKYHQIIAIELGKKANLIAFCPEVAIGLGIPRPAMHLVDINGAIHAVDKAHAKPDYTQLLSSQGDNYLLAEGNLHGYIFQDKSPSCGVDSVKIHDKNGALLHTHGRGIFAATIIKALPDLPVIEAQQLNSLKAVNDFLVKVQHYQD